MAKKQIKDILIRVDSKGASAANKELANLTKNIDNAQGSSNRLNVVLSRSLKSLEQLEKRAVGAASGFKGLGSSIRSLNTAMSGDTKTATKKLNAYLDNLEIVGLALQDLQIHAVATAKAMKEVGSGMDTLSSSSISAEELTGHLLQITHALEDISNSTNEAVGEMQQMRSSIDDVNRSSERADEGIDDLNRGFSLFGKTLKKVNPKLTHANNETRRLAGNGRSASKSFAKLATASNPLVNTYAAIAVNVIAVNEALRLLGEAAGITRLIQNLGTMGAQTGTNLNALAQSMNELSGSSLSLAEAAKLASRSMAQGFSSEQMLKLTELAKKASIALGINFSDAMERVTKGIAKQEVELLDELGVVTRLEPALKRYSDQLGKTVEQLTDSERTTALYVETVSQLESAYSSINIEATGVEVLSKAMGDTFLKLGQIIADVVDGPFKEWGLAIKMAFADPQKDVEQFGSLVTATLSRISDAGSMGMVMGSGSIANLINEGTMQQKKLNDEINTNIALRAKLSKELVRQIRTENMLKQKGEGGVFGKSAEFLEAFHKVRQLRKEISSLDGAIAEGTPARNTLVNDLLELREHTGFINFSESELQTISKGFQSLSESSTKSTAELGKWANKLKDTRGPLFLTVQSIEGLISEFESLKSKTKGNPLLDTDLVRTRNAVLKKFNEQFQTSFTTLKALAIHVSEVNTELFNLDRQLKHIGDTPGLSKLEAAVQQTDRILAALTRSSNMSADQQRVLRDRLDVLGRISDIEKANEAIARMQTADTIRLMQWQRSGAVALVESKQATLDVEQASLDIQFESRQISLFEREQQQAILDARKELLTTEESIADLRDQSTMLQALQTLEGLTNLQTTALDLGIAVTDIFATMGESGLSFIELMKTDAESFMDLSVSIANAAGQIFGAMSEAKVAGIDREIDAEKRRDGKSIESLAKIKKLEAEKIKVKLKADKAAIAMSTATAIMQTFSTYGATPPGFAMAAVMAGLGAMQMSQLDKAANGQLAGLNDSAGGGMSITGGSRDNSVDVSQSASAGELAFRSTIQGRAGGGISSGGASIMTGERGPEEITPILPVNVSTTGEGGSGASITFSPIFNINAIDSQSFEETMEAHGAALYSGLETELRARHMTLENLGL